MALRDVVRRRLRGARSSLSRTTSDFEILRPRDSASMSATKGSGNRTVRVFMNSVYYISDSSARQAAEPNQRHRCQPSPPAARHYKEWRTSDLEFGQDRLTRPHPLQAFELTYTTSEVLRVAGLLKEGLNSLTVLKLIKRKSGLNSPRPFPFSLSTKNGALRVWGGLGDPGVSGDAFEHPHFCTILIDNTMIKWNSTPTPVCPDCKPCNWGAVPKSAFGTLPMLK